MYCGSCLRDNALAPRSCARARRRADARLHADPDRRAQRQPASRRSSAASASSSSSTRRSSATRRAPRPAVGRGVGDQAGVEAPDQGRPAEPRRDDRLDAARRPGLPAEGDRQAARLAAHRAAVRRHQPAVHAAHRARRTAQADAERADLLHAAGRGPVSRRPRRAVEAAVDGSDPRGERARRRVPAGQPLLFRLHAGYLGIPPEKMRLVPLGINLEGYGRALRGGTAVHDRLPGADCARERACTCSSDAYRRLRTRPGSAAATRRGRLSAPEHRGYLDGIVSDLRAWGLGGEFEYRGEVDRAQKIEFLRASTSCRCRRPTTSRRASSCSRRWPTASRSSSRGAARSRDRRRDRRRAARRRRQSRALADGFRRSGKIRRARPLGAPARPASRALQRGSHGRSGRTRSTTGAVAGRASACRARGRTRRAQR